MKPLPYISLIFILAVFIGSIPVLTGCTLTISIKGIEKSKVEPIKVEEVKVVEVKKIKKSNYDAIKDSLYGTWRNLPLPDDHKNVFK